MKFYLKQKIISNLPPSANEVEKVSGVTEYEALRAEKLFRYEYSNQLNTGLLTFAFTIFTAGLVVFALILEFGDFFKIVENAGENSTVKNLYAVFVEYFFACFFLLPCFFARVNFRYTAKNSLRIGQLTDYIREKIQFDDNESWETFKRDYGINYFYRNPSGVGGAKDIPMWINIISHAISLIVGLIGVWVLTQSNEDFEKITLILWGYIIVRILISIGFSFYNQLTTKQIKKCYYFRVVIANAIVDILEGLIIWIYQISQDVCFWSNIKPILPFIILILIWLELLQFCMFIAPQYDREILLANSVLEHTKAALEYSKNHSPTEETTINRSKAIFLIFLNKSSVLQKYRNKYDNKAKKIVKKCMPIYKQIDINNKYFTHSTKESLLQEYLSGEKSK